MNEIKIKLMSDGAKMPTLATDGSAAYDLYTSEDFLIKRGRCALPTDVALEMPRNIKANVRARSGFSVKGFEAYAYVLDKNGNRVISDMPERINADVVLGLVDSDFRNAIKVIVKSDDDRTMLVPKGTRVAQLEFAYVPDIQLTQVTELSQTDRGMNGFGHSGNR